VYIAVGRIRLKPDTARFCFLWLTLRAWWQARRAPGCVHASLFGEDRLTYWSMSAWRSPREMMDYRNAGSHLKAMQAARTFAESVEFAHWQADEIPDWPSAKEQFRRQR
jgi:hypothetical protein